MMHWEAHTYTLGDTLSPEAETASNHEKTSHKSKLRDIILICTLDKYQGPEKHTKTEEPSGLNLKYVTTKCHIWSWIRSWIRKNCVSFAIKDLSGILATFEYSF